METIFAIAIGGLLATLFWITIMFVFIWKGFHHGDMISVIGSDITNKPALYFSRGLLLYVLSGILLSPIYYFILSWLAFASVISNMGFGAFMGFSQGFLFMHLFVEEPAQHHPSSLLEKFLIPIAVVHWIGHMAYGLALGALLSSYLNHGWAGLSVSGLSTILLSLVISFFVMRGAHKQAVLERQQSQESSATESASQE